jgi:hypothetical protein
LTRRLIDADPWSGVSTWFDYDHSTGDTIITRTQDVETVLDRARDLRNDGGHWKNNSKLDDEKVDMRLGAIVPLIVVEKWLREEGANLLKAGKDSDHLAACRKLVNSRDWQWLRTTEKKL